jgi:predicted alpha/beta hydrolase
VSGQADPVELRIATGDGVTLSLRRYPARGRRRAVCLCTHAMMASSRYFAAGEGHGFAGYLSGAGVDVFALDWRGHGQSRPRTSRAHRRWCFDDYVDHDLPAAVAAVCRAADVAPTEIILAGHSLGGLVSLAALATGTIVAPRGLALWATSLWLPGPRGSLRRRAIMTCYDLMSRPLGYAPIRALGLGSDNEPRGYVQQLVGWARTGQWRSRQGVDYLAALGRIDTPVFSACGLGDRLCLPRDAEVLRSRLRPALPLRVVGVSRGDAVDADHFTLFTHRALAPLWDEFIGFCCESVAGAGQPGA